MPTLREIAEDPRKSLNELEKGLGVTPGTLLQDMDGLAGAADEWKSHVPYGVAAAYYEDEGARTQYQGHVDSCAYCKALLETLYPSDPQVTDFAERAAAVVKREQKQSRFRPFDFYGGLLMAGAAGVLVTLASVQVAGVRRAPAGQTKLVVNELRQEPGVLGKLETSNVPTERYRAAQYYFSVEQPQLAYRQIGEGLELAGVSTSDAHKITTAADVPADKSAATLENAAYRLTELESVSWNKNPEDYLETAEAQAKLGLHDDALKSIRRYLKARNSDPKLVEEFSETALARAPTDIDVAK